MKMLGSLFIGFAVVCFCSEAAFAQPMGFPPGAPPHMMRGHGRSMMGEGPGPGLMLPLVLNHAGLTSAQSDQVHKIMEADHDALRALFNQLQAANDDLASKLFAAGNVQAADLAPQVQRITQLRQQLMEQGLKTTLAIRAVLKPEQLTKVAQLKTRMDKLQAEMRSIMDSKD